MTILPDSGAFTVASYMHVWMVWQFDSSYMIELINLAIFIYSYWSDLPRKKNYKNLQVGKYRVVIYNGLIIMSL